MLRIVDLCTCTMYFCLSLFLLCSSNDSDHSSVYKEAVFILSSLSPLSIPELVSTARSLILPVCMGVARPFLPSLMNDKHRVSEELFTLPPACLHRQIKSSFPVAGVSEVGVAGMGGVGDGVSDSESEVGEGEETHTHGDASSTATIGSGPIPFFSDQVGVGVVAVVDSAFFRKAATARIWTAWGKRGHWREGR